MFVHLVAGDGHSEGVETPERLGLDTQGGGLAHPALLDHDLREGQHVLHVVLPGLRTRRDGLVNAVVCCLLFAEITRTDVEIQEQA